MQLRDARLKIGWAQADITPDRPVILAGQFHARVSEGVLDPVTATAMAVEAGGGISGHVVMVSCDLASIGNELRDAVRERVEAADVGLDPNCVFIGATHTHSAPDARLVPYGMEQCADEYRRLISPDGGSPDARRFGMWPDVGLDVMSPADYLEFALSRITDAVVEAWEQRRPSGIAYGLGHAVIGRNRRLTYRDGTSQMYGQPGTPEFSHVEGYEDHSVYVMTTCDADQRITGMVVNVPCPSQVSEHIYQVSADYWHETREELRERFGADLFILAQCAPAGDQSPHVLIGRRAEERMWRLKGRGGSRGCPCCIHRRTAALRRSRDRHRSRRRPGT